MPDHQPPPGLVLWPDDGAASLPKRGQIYFWRYQNVEVLVNS